MCVGGWHIWFVVFRPLRFLRGTEGLYSVCIRACNWKMTSNNWWLQIIIYIFVVNCFMRSRCTNIFVKLFFHRFVEKVQSRTFYYFIFLYFCVVKDKMVEPMVSLITFYPLIHIACQIYNKQYRPHAPLAGTGLPCLYQLMS